VVEGAALEKRYPVKNGIVGSNPTLSAKRECAVGMTTARQVDGLESPGSTGHEATGGAIGSTILLFCGEMSELAEGTRLEIVCAANNGTVGSNPTLSATSLSPSRRLQPAAIAGAGRTSLELVA
jgi:hypothetical protein